MQELHKLLDEAIELAKKKGFNILGYFRTPHGRYSLSIQKRNGIEIENYAGLFDMYQAIIYRANLKECFANLATMYSLKNVTIASDETDDKPNPKVDKIHETLAKKVVKAIKNLEDDETVLQRTVCSEFKKKEVDKYKYETILKKTLIVIQRELEEGDFYEIEETLKYIQREFKNIVKFGC